MRRLQQGSKQDDGAGQDHKSWRCIFCQFTNPASKRRCVEGAIGGNSCSERKPQNGCILSINGPHIE